MCPYRADIGTTLLCRQPFSAGNFLRQRNFLYIKNKCGIIYGTDMKQIAYNRSAGFEYFIEEKFEAGIALEGAEVKALRQGKCNLKDSF